MKSNTRGQLEVFPIWPLVLVAVLTLGIVVAKTIIGEVGSVDMASIETTCLGLWGCGGPTPLGIASTVGLLLLVIGSMVMAVRGWLPRR